MAVRFSTGLRNSLLDTSSLKTIFTDGIIEIRTGAQPAAADDLVTGTLLGTVTLDAGAFTPGAATNGLEFGTASAGVIGINPGETWKFNAIATGVAGWFRFKGNALDNDAASTTLPRIDGSVGKGTGDMSLSVTSLTTGAPTTIDTFNLTLNQTA